MMMNKFSSLTSLGYNSHFPFQCISEWSPRKRFGHGNQLSSIKTVWLIEIFRMEENNYWEINQTSPQMSQKLFEHLKTPSVIRKGNKCDVGGTESLLHALNLMFLTQLQQISNPLYGRNEAGPCQKVRTTEKALNPHEVRRYWDTFFPNQQSYASQRQNSCSGAKQKSEDKERSIM